MCICNFKAKYKGQRPEYTCEVTYENGQHFVMYYVLILGQESFS